MPTITGQTFLPDDTSPLEGTWFYRIRTDQAAATAAGRVRAGVGRAVDSGAGATATIPNGVYDFRFVSAARSGDGQVLLPPLPSRWYTFEVTANTTWDKVMTTPVLVPVTPADVVLAQQARSDAQAAATSATSSATLAGQARTAAQTAATQTTQDRTATEQARAATVAAAMYELRGTGSPEGAVTASPGTYYTDTAITNGAARWVKVAGTGNTGWRVSVGTTGLRNVGSLRENGWTGSVYLRRSADGVTLHMEALTGTAATADRVMVLPDGFRPFSGASLNYVTPMNGGRQLIVDTSAGAAVTPRGGTVWQTTTWTTGDPWPATLPGAAV